MAVYVDPTFAAFIRTALNTLSETTLANRFGVPLATVREWEQGQSIPHPVVRLMISEMLAQA